MYRTHRQGIGIQALLILIVLGVIGGVGFFLYDNYLRPATTTPPLPTIAAALPTLIATPFEPAATAATPVIMGHIPANDSALFIPSIGVYAPIITSIIRDGTWDVANLGHNVGYLQGTAWVDVPGNIGLAGHVTMSSGETGIFSALHEVANGDLVVITEGASQYNYAVVEVKYVEPNDLSVVYPTGKDVLTMITCSDYNLLSNTYDSRLVVVAEKIG